MDEATLQLMRGTAFALATAVALALQRLSPHARLRGSWRVNLGLWALNVTVVSAVCGACACAMARWAAAAGVGLLNAAAAPAWVAVLATVVVLDLVSYGWHRANHTVPFLWRFHRVHHSDAAFTVSTGVRFHPGELLMSLPLRLAAVAALGPPVVGVIAFEAAFTLANLVEHGDIDLPARLERRLARLLVTPALHRRHHAQEQAKRDSNFGTLFSCWDRLLGSYGDSTSAARVSIGLADAPPPATVLAAIRLPLAPG